MSSKNARASRLERAAAAQAQQARQERRRRLVMIGGVVAVIVAIVVAGVLIQSARDTSGDVTATPAGSGEYGVTVGDPDAPHQVVIYEDFLCPFCGELEARTGEELAAAADEGRVYLEYRPFNLLAQVSDYSERATSAFAVVLAESGPEVAKSFHDLLYDEQPEEGGPYPDNEALLALAVEAGADEAAVRDGILGTTETDWVEEATAAAREAGVRGTPTVLVDGEVFQSGGSIDDFADALLEQVS